MSESLKPMSIEVFDAARNVMRDIEGSCLSHSLNELGCLAGRSRSALFVAQRLQLGNCTTDEGVHVLHLIEVAHEALSGRFEELEDAIDARDTAIRWKIGQLALERQALRRALAAVVGILGASELDRITEAAEALAAAHPIPPDADGAAVWEAFTTQLQRRGVEIAFEKRSPCLPASPVAYTKESLMREKAIRKMSLRHARKIVSVMGEPVMA